MPPPNPKGALHQRLFERKLPEADGSCAKPLGRLRNSGRKAKKEPAWSGHC